MTGYRFPRRLRLRRPAEFQDVFQRKCSTADSFLVVYAAPGQQDHPRLGLTVSRKVGSAVVRNRWKRTLREAFRLAQHRLPALDIICIPRPRAVPDVGQLSQSLLVLTGRLSRRIDPPAPADAAGGMRAADPEVR